MSRRKSNEPGFNSDSFLDIVCNLVGIMIILILVAGLRVSRAPVQPLDSEPAPAAPVAIDAQPEPDPELSAINATELSKWLELAPAAPLIDSESPPEPPPAEEPPEDLIAQTEELRRLVDRCKQRQAEFKNREDAARRNRADADRQLKHLAESLSSARSESRNARKQAEEAALEVQQLERQAAQLTSKLAALADEQAAPQVLRHSVTPVSRQVSQKDELHFRLSGNRVAVVPLEALAEALKFRMQRNGDLFLRVNRYEGTAGPVEGFLMRYVIEKQKPSVIEELRSGGSFVRIQLAYYELEAGPDAVTESVDQALTPGSRFLSALARARPGTSLTFWVYPDSFDLHRALQEYAHEARFDVAARPLPVGVPIAGSPNGSRSVAQ